MEREQLRAILWLRWRLTRNQWRRSRGLGQGIAVVLGVFAALGGAASFAGGLAAGWFAGRLASPLPVAVAAFVLGGSFAFMWTIGVLIDLQRSELIDIPRLLQLPVGLAPVYFVNYLASHVGLSIVLTVPAMIGLTAGAVAARGAGMLLLGPLLLSLVFCTTAWTYCFQGWIAAWMTNPRRRRVVVTGLTMVVVLAGQLPNVLVNVFRVHRTHWLSDALGAAARPGSFALAAAVLAGMGGLGLWRGYRDTLRFYTGGAGRRGVGVGVGVGARRRLVERSVPGLPEPASAIATATLRSVLRAPEAALAFGASVVVSCVVGATVVVRVRHVVTEAFKPVAIEAAMALSVFMLVPFLCNQFGFDRDGFRALVLAPVDRRLLLLGKNAALLCVAPLLCAPLLLAAAVGLHAGPLVLVAALLQMTAMLFTAAIVGNVLSILVPYRMAAGSLKASGLPPSAWLAVVGCQLFFPALFTPAFVPTLAVLWWHHAGWPLPALADVVLSLVVAGVAVVLYAVTLGPLGRLLQRREPIVLARVTMEHE